MTVLHFAEASDTSGYFVQLAKWRDRRRYRMIFGTLRSIEPGLAEGMSGQGVECFSYGCSSRWSYPSALVRLASFLRRRRVDVLHTHLFEPSVVGLLSGILASTKIRVLTRHYSDLHTRIGKTWHVRLDRMCTRLAHAVIAVSNHTAEHMLAAEGASPGKIQVVLNGIDFDRVAPSPEASTRIRRELGAENAAVLLVLARLNPEKGHMHLFRALPGLRRRVRRRILLLVAGTGPFEEHYRQEVARLGCEDVVRFLGFRQDAADLIVASDAVVLPTLSEGFGMVAVEALYLGTPIVASGVGAIPEIVEDGVDGLLVPAADSDALENALVNLLSEPDLRYRLAGAGTAKVKARFDARDMVRRYETIYAGLASTHARPGCDLEA